jgi:hypothetical protein
MRINNPLSLTLGLPLCLFLACSNSSVKTENEPAPEADTTAAAPQEVTIASSDGVCAIIATGGWQQASGLHKKAQLQASNTYGDMYLVVFSEKKDRYGDLSLEDHSKTTRDHLQKRLLSHHFPSVPFDDRWKSGCPVFDSRLRQKHENCLPSHRSGKSVLFSRNHRLDSG